MNVAIEDDVVVEEERQVSDGKRQQAGSLRCKKKMNLKKDLKAWWSGRWYLLAGLSVLSKVCWPGFSIRICTPLNRSWVFSVRPATSPRGVFVRVTPRTTYQFLEF